MTFKYKKLIVAVTKTQVAVSVWPTARPFAGISWMKSIGTCADWRDRTYFLTGRWRKMLRRPGQLFGHIP